MGILCNNGVHTNVYNDEVDNDPDDVFVSMTPDLVVVATLYNLDTYHVLDSLMCKLCVTIYMGHISISGL